MPACRFATYARKVSTDKASGARSNGRLSVVTLISELVHPIAQHPFNLRQPVLHSENAATCRFRRYARRGECAVESPGQRSGGSPQIDSHDW
jgi:hypothetical protein